MNRIGFLLLISALFFSCNQNNNATQNSNTTPTPNEQPAPTLPGIPTDEVQNLWEHCDYVDIVFYNLPFSMSIDNQPGIRTNLQMIANQPVVLNSKCQSMGRIFYQIDAVNVLEADIVYGDGCNYFIFYKDNKQVYANRMTPNAIQYFTNIITQVKVE